MPTKSQNCANSTRRHRSPTQVTSSSSRTEGPQPPAHLHEVVSWFLCTRVDACWLGLRTVRKHVRHHADLVVNRRSGPDERAELFRNRPLTPPLNHRVKDQLVATCR